MCASCYISASPINAMYCRKIAIANENKENEKKKEKSYDSTGNVGKNITTSGRC